MVRRFIVAMMIMISPDRGMIAQEHPARQADTLLNEFVGCSVGLIGDSRVIVAGWTSPAKSGLLMIALLDDNGAQIRPTIVINRALNAPAQNAQICVLDNGTAIVIWEQATPSGTQIFSCSVNDNEGAAVAPRSLMESTTMSGANPGICASGDRAIAVWEQFEPGGARIVSREINTTGAPAGPIVQVSPHAVNAMYPSVAANRNGERIFGWQDGIYPDFHVKIRAWFPSRGWDSLHIVDSALGQAYSTNPTLCFADSTVVIVWKDYRRGTSDIFQQRYVVDSLLHPAAGNVLVNDDSTSRWQRLPHIAQVDARSYVVIWEDYRHDAGNQIGDIYGQLYRRDGVPVGENFRLHDTPEPCIQEFPSLASNARGRFVAGWIEARQNTLHAIVQVFDSHGATHGPQLLPFADVKP